MRVRMPGRLDVQISLMAERSGFTSARGLWLGVLLTLLFSAVLWTGAAKASVRGPGETILESFMAPGDSVSPSAAQPSYPGGTLDGLFTRPGFIGGFAAGFLGAGFVGLLFGHGFAAGVGGIASVLGVLLQLVLIVALVRVIWTWWRQDRAARAVELSPRQLADAYGRLRHGVLPDIGGDTASGTASGQRQGDPFKQATRLRP